MAPKSIGPDFLPGEMTCDEKYHNCTQNFDDDPKQLEDFVEKPMVAAYRRRPAYDGSLDAEAERRRPDKL